MASQEQLAVSEQVKKVHLWLRTRSQEVGAQQAWKEHLQRKDILKEYASAMKILGEKYWTQRNQAERQSYCRIEWIRQCIIDYFFNGARERLILKERLRFKLEHDTFEKAAEGKLKLLDAGSCYNPFKTFDFCDTYAIDLSPASPDVKECNFLAVQVVSQPPAFWYSEEVTYLPRDFFDVVVFCLFLEYLPAPEQRLKSCEIARDILKMDGLLLIVTPDSNHQSANAPLMKSWKFALQQIGFIRYRIEKLKYLYCMAFRKTNYPEHYRTCGEIPTISIPQDFVDYSSKDTCSPSDSFDCSLDDLPQDWDLSD